MAESAVVCPRCNESNSVSSLFCQRCGAALTPPTEPARAPEAAAVPGPSPTKRMVYVLLAVLPAFCLAIGGIHNLVAGYNERGGIQLGLSLVVWVFGVILAIFIVPLCIAIPAWIALVVWCIVDAVQVTHDAQGRPMI